MKHNLELLKCMLEVWKQCIVKRVDMDILERLLCSTQQGEEGSGVQVLAALLANEMIDTELITDPKLAQSLTARLTHKHTKVNKI